MYRIAVCEDEPIFLKYISEMTVDILSSIGESCEIWKYTSALGLESALQEDSGAYDILILEPSNSASDTKIDRGRYSICYGVISYSGYYVY